MSSVRRPETCGNSHCLQAGREGLRKQPETAGGSGSVTQWNGQVLPTARGGAIPDGLYRQAYILAEKGSGTTFGVGDAG